MVNGGRWRAACLIWCRMATVALAVTTVPAAAMELELPIACTPGSDCWLVRLPDHNPSQAFTDYRCGRLGSDGHDGTDFAIADARRMAEGVPVLAAAAGSVRGVRDGVPDQPAEGRLAHAFGERNCGNGVVLDHPDGWETQYCHLRRGSVRVATGDHVAKGEILGLVGMSGEANFPHVHLSVRHAGVTMDPFTGGPLETACGDRGVPLWPADLLDRLAYLEVPIAVVGLTDHLPDRDAIVAGTAGAASTTAAPALVAYALAYGLQAGDRLSLSILAPDGTQVSDAAFTMDADADRVTRAAGRRMPPAGWQPGIYRVEVTVRRGERSFARSATYPLAQ